MRSDRSERHNTDKSGFRPDVEGLRAVAVVAVLLYHAGLPFVPGGYVGVDVFLVISGFLITGLLVTELRQTGTISLAGFYARRVRRLLPAAFVVLAAVAALSLVLFDPVRRADVSGDVVASALYVSNWRFALQAVDYFAGASESPVQHYWTLAVEEQFYLVWPVLLLAVAWCCRRYGWRPGRALLTAFVSVGVLSFAASLWFTYWGAADAYFSTFTRGWELALGGGLALVLATGRRVPPRLAGGLALLGAGGIVWAAGWFDDATAFPGAAALLPTLGAAAVIAAGASVPGTRVARVLALRPVRHVGRLSYSWYLWHWPLLVFAAAAWGELSAWQGLLVVAGSWLPAAVTYRLVETPVRRHRGLAARPARSLRLGVALTAGAAVSGLLLQLTMPSLPVADPKDVPAAKAAEQGVVVQTAASAVRPDPRKAKQDRSKVYSDGCIVGQAETSPPDCVYGDPNGEVTVAAFGDSMMMQFVVALDDIGKREGWRVVVYTKSNCPPADVRVYNASFRRDYPECDQWRERAMRQLDKEQPAMVLMSGRSNYRVAADGERLDVEQSKRELTKGWQRTVDELNDNLPAQLVVMEPTAHPEVDVPSCVSEHLNKLKECSTPRDKALDRPRVNAEVADENDDVELVDPTPMLCDGAQCPAVIGNAIVYRETDHLTATYAKSLAPWLKGQLPDPVAT